MISNIHTRKYTGMYLTEWRALGKLDNTIVFDHEKGGKKYYEIDGALHNSDTSIIRKKWYHHGIRHRESEPAVVWFNESGNVVREEWYYDNKLHNSNGPANIYYYDNGMKKREEWYLHGKLCNLYGIDVIKYYPDGTVMMNKKNYYRSEKLLFFDSQGEVEQEEWYLKGKLHNLDGPAVVNNNYKAWYQQGKLYKWTYSEVE